MDFTAILTAIGPLLVSFLQNFSKVVVAPTQPAPPAPNPPAGTVAAPDQAIKDLQTMLNTVLALNPPLAVDGWLGPKTDAAIEAGIAKLKAAGIG